MVGHQQRSDDADGAESDVAGNDVARWGTAPVQANNAVAMSGAGPPAATAMAKPPMLAAHALCRGRLIPAKFPCQSKSCLKILARPREFHLNLRRRQADNWSSNALAFFRSSVSNPSVNLP